MNYANLFYIFVKNRKLFTSEYVKIRKLFSTEYVKNPRFFIPASLPKTPLVSFTLSHIHTFTHLCVLICFFRLSIASNIIRVSPPLHFTPSTIKNRPRSDFYLHFSQNFTTFAPQRSVNHLSRRSPT